MEIINSYKWYRYNRLLFIRCVYYEKSIIITSKIIQKNIKLLDSLCNFIIKFIIKSYFINKNYFGFSNNTNIYLSSQVFFKLNPDFMIFNNILINDQNGIIILIKMNLGLYIQDSLIERLEKFSK